MNFSSHDPRWAHRGLGPAPAGSRKGSAWVQTLLGIGFVAALTAIVLPLAPLALPANHLDQGIATLARIMQKARDAAVANNTYVWVAMTSTNSVPAKGIWVATIQSQNGAESPIMASGTSWSNAIALPGAANLQMVGDLVNLPGVQVVDLSGLPPGVAAAAAAKNAPGGNMDSLYAPAGMQWTITSPPPEGANTGAFVKAIEFTPAGEAHTGATTAAEIQFGMVTTSDPLKGALIDVSRASGTVTAFQP